MEASQQLTRLQWIKIGASDILFVDLSHLTADQALAVTEDFRRELAGRPPASVLLLVDVTNTGYEASIAMRWKSLCLEGQDTIRAIAVVGATGLVGVALGLFSQVARFLEGASGAWEKLRGFSGDGEARAWLVEQ